jgi:hypothetical protein
MILASYNLGKIQNFENLPLSSKEKLKWLFTRYSGKRLKI